MNNRDIYDALWAQSNIDINDSKLVLGFDLHNVEIQSMEESLLTMIRTSYLLAGGSLEVLPLTSLMSKTH